MKKNNETPYNLTITKRSFSNSQDAYITRIESVVSGSGFNLLVYYRKISDYTEYCESLHV